MERSWYTRLVLVLLVTLGAIWLLVPSYYSFFVLEKKDRNNVELLREKLPGWAKPAARFRLSLGLDLQGGIHTVMRVDTKTALEKRVERQGLRMANWVKEKKLGEITTSTNPDKLELTLKATDPASMDAIEKEVLDVFLDYSKVSREGAALTLALRQGAVDGFVEESVGQAMLVIRRRIDKWGVAEVDVRKVGTDSIQISLPGQQDPEQAKELIGTTAQLEFRIVDTGQGFSEIYKNNPPEQGSGITLINDSREGFPQLSAENREVLLAYVKGKAPENREILLHCVESESKKKSCSSYTTFLVEKEVPLTGESLTGADARQNTTNNQAEVNFQFDAAGARDLDNLTAKNVGHRMAVVLDDNVVMAPTIESRISGGSGVITLGRQGKLEDRMKEAHTTAITLKAGALPAPVTVGEVRQVGASLGDELVKRGSTAAGVGLLLVILFMAIYYKVSGLVADVALVLNGALILSGLAFFGGTLTLPGIAGFVLTLGIAVDANVLINERIREELSLGKTARSAVDQGYDRAFWTIFDAHVTTLIAGFILAFTGTGPVQGFATALIIGIIASLFTSIVVTRLIVTWLVHGRNAQSVSV
ncbi:MAG: protein translocase subunit SecD [Myxococcaceae bacterium]|nr:protein translocase subunit SecD [Myxococcaceae bacterium]